MFVLQYAELWDTSFLWISKFWVVLARFYLKRIHHCTCKMWQICFPSLILTFVTVVVTHIIPFHWFWYSYEASNIWYFFFTCVIKMMKCVTFLHDFHTSWVTGERISMGSICYYVLILLYIHLALQQCINIHFFCMFWYLIFMYFLEMCPNFELQYKI